jgi:hypothetical protein
MQTAHATPGIRRIRALAVCAVTAFIVVSGAGIAGTPSANDCTEGADFIANAARARDNGVTRQKFIEQMEADFLSIRAFPRELRWFVQDEDDEAFLLGAARNVFDRPEDPEAHRIDFFRACLKRRYI